MKKSTESRPFIEQAGMNAEKRGKMKGYVNFTSEDARALTDLLPLITKHSDQIVEKFYAHIQHYPELLALIIAAGSSVEKLCAYQKRYLLSLFKGDYEESYFEDRLHIGAIHSRVGLTLDWYLGTYNVYFEAIIPLILRQYIFRTRKQKRALLALFKLISLDSILIAEMYTQKTRDIETADYRGKLQAIDKSLAAIEFDLDGVILNANENFLKMMGYTLDEIVGQHHKIFVDPIEATSPEYREFWTKLGRGEFDGGEYKRIAKDGKEVWLQSTYNPILDINGKPVKVVKYATDISERKLRGADVAGQLAAVSKALAVIEFNMDGSIITANQNFLNTMGYTLAELQGKHHRLFVDPTYANSAEYQAFWEKLGRGEFDAGQYQRVAKGGREVWLQSSYNPILDLNGRPFKIVKYATDITLEKEKNLDYQERVKKISTVIEHVAEGDLRYQVELHGNDELNTLGQSLNKMIESLSIMANGTLEASNVMASTLEELQVAVGSQSSAASEQAAAVNETTTTLEEIRVASSQTLAKTQHMGEIAERTKREGEQGQETVAEALVGIESLRNQMENIAQTILALSEQTQQIGEITSVVTNLAQQSKMLALNASIEAAKAGEAGKGFSVVAGEVKELAEQSQESTAQVQKILQDIRHATDRAVMATEEGSKGVDSGLLLVQNSGAVMKVLLEVINEAGLASQQIVAAVHQEVAGIEQTTAAMSEINKVTEHFVKGTQQTKQAADDLSHVAEKMRKNVALYRLAKNDVEKIKQD